MKEFIGQRQILGQTPIGGPIVLEWDAEEVWSGLELAGTGSWVGDMRSDYSLSEAHSLYLRTGDPAVDDQSLEAHMLLYPPPHGLIRFDIPFLFPTMTGSIYWNWSIQAIHALPDHTCIAFTLLYIWPLYWYVGTTVDEEMVWQYIEGSDQVLAPDTWHRLTLRVDYNTQKYVDFQCGTLNLDLSDVDPVDIYYTAGEDNKEFLVMLIDIYAYGGWAQPPTEVYFDQFTFYEE